MLLGLRGGAVLSRSRGLPLPHPLLLLLLLQTRCSTVAEVVRHGATSPTPLHVKYPPLNWAVTWGAALTGVGDGTVFPGVFSAVLEHLPRRWPIGAMGGQLPPPLLREGGVHCPAAHVLLLLLQLMRTVKAHRHTGGACRV